MPNSFIAANDLPDDFEFVCDNCAKPWRMRELLNPIEDIEERVAVGEMMPAGECPSCGALCHVPGYEVMDVRIKQCAEQLYRVMKDLMPQMGKMVTQDYAQLDRGMMLGEQLFEKNQRRN